MQTMGIGLGQSFEVPHKLLMLQYSDGNGHWREVEQIKEAGHVVGRTSFRSGTPAVEFLAAEHLRIVIEADQIFVEEGDTLNGVYIKIPAGRPVELLPGSRFQVGQHVIEFREPEPPGLDQAVISKDHEMLRWRRLEPLAYLVFTGPDDGPGITFPLTKVEGTIIGRVGDISLTGDTWASRSHARVSRQGDRFFLEDLGSTNGTFIKMIGKTPLQPGNSRNTVVGDVLLLGSVLVRIIEI